MHCRGFGEVLVSGSLWVRRMREGVRMLGYSWKACSMRA